MCCRGKPTRAFERDRKSTRLNSSHSQISYAVFCLKKKKHPPNPPPAPPPPPPPPPHSATPALAHPRPAPSPAPPPPPPTAPAPSPAHPPYLAPAPDASCQRSYGLFGPALRTYQRLARSLPVRLAVGTMPVSIAHWCLYGLTTSARRVLS